MIDLKVYAVKDGRVCGLVTGPPSIKNGNAYFFFPEYGVAIEDAYPCALDLSRALNTALTISGDVGIFQKMYPNVSVTLAFKNS